MHLIFISEKDYDEIKKIDRMVEKYFLLEKSKKELVLFYLKDMKVIWRIVK